MRWRSIVLSALGVAFGIAAAFCVTAEARLYLAITAIYSAAGASAPSAAQSATAAALNSQLGWADQLGGPLVTGSLICVVALLTVLAWRWQTRRIAGQD